MINTYIKGNIVEIFRAGNDIAHGCNCHCMMAAGIAGQLAQNFLQIPEADDLEDDYWQNRRDKLGKFTIATHDNGKNVCYNLYTQYHGGPNLDYGALLNCFMNLNMVRTKESIKRSLFIPRIGAGIAGGDWKIIEKLINIATPDIEVVVVDYDPSVVNPVTLTTGEVVSLDFLETADKIYRDPKRLP